jgi:hypothetical protein
VTRALLVIALLAQAAYARPGAPPELGPVPEVDGRVCAWAWGLTATATATLNVDVDLGGSVDVDATRACGGR